MPARHAKQSLEETLADFLHRNGNTGFGDPPDSDFSEGWMSCCDYITDYIMPKEKP